MRSIVRRVTTPAVAAVLLIALAGCSSVLDLRLRPSGDPLATTAAAPPTQVAAPLLTGMSLAGALDYSAQKGITLSAQDASAAARDVRYPELWIVVSQDRGVGEVAMSDEVITVAVLKRDETTYSSDTLADASAMTGRNRLMIDFVGMDLGDARAAAEENDLFILDEDDASGDDRSVWLASNWVVVAQDVPPGGWETTVTLLVLKDGESTDDMPPAVLDPHDSEMTFVGVVTGYEDGDWGGDGSVVVDGAPIELDLISPFGSRCLDTVDDSAAYAERERQLPIGTTVIVERSSLSNDRGFIHIEAAFDPANRFSNSVNEQLVRSGFWAPDDTAILNSSPAPDGTVTFYDINVAPGYLNPVQALYVPAIVAAGNEVLVVPVGGMIECATQATTTQAEFAARAAETEERMRLWEEEYQRRLASGYYSCRDGDGDGVCYER